MKHAKHFLLTAAMLLGSLAANAETVEIEGIWYYLDTETMEATVQPSGGMYYSDYSGSITIPATVIYEDMEYSVTRIGDCTFEDCYNLTSITIPEGVTEIGGSAFSGCSGLSSVAIPEGVTEIGTEAFYRCSNLTSVTLPESLTLIGRRAFYECRNLTAVYISNIEAWCKVRVEGDYYFDYSSPLCYAQDLYLNGELVKELVIPEGVTEIGNYAFYDCDSLTSITIPEGVTEIGDYAFDDCSNLTTIILPESLTSIGEEAFSSCQSLTSITIPASVTKIGDYAFSFCTSLTSITIPEHSKLASVSEYTFHFCLSLKSITIPESVTDIKRGAFNGCRSLASITIPEGVTMIRKEAFRDCSVLTSITCCAVVPPTCESTSFSGVPTSTPVNVPENSADAYQSAEVWKDFTRIIAGAPVLSQYSAILFEGKSMTLTATLTLVTAADKSLTWSSSNPEVAEVDDEGNVTAVAEGTAIITVAVDNGQGVSASCEVSVKKTPVLSIEELSNAVLYHIYTPRGSWAVAEGGDRLATNDDLDIDINSDDTRQQFAFVSNDGVSYYLYHVAEKKFVNWNGTLSLGANAPVYFKAGAYENTFMIYFGEYHYINIGGSNQLTIDNWNTADDGNSYTIVPVGEFKLLVNVVDGITYSQLAEGEAEVIGGQQASGDVEIPETVMIGEEKCKVTSIGEQAFDNCYLSSITIPEGVTSIGNRAFNNCRGLISITCYATTPPETIYGQLGDTFAGVDKSIPLYVPKTAVADYQSAEGWNYFTNIIGMEHEDGEANGVLNIPSQPVIIQCADGVIILTGLAEETEVSIYDMSGRLVGTATAANGTATINTNLESESFAIVKIGNTSIRVVIG